MTQSVHSSADRMPLVTVALAVLNGGSLLEGAVRSIVYQSMSDWELVLLDDGSTDGAIERLPFLQDPRIIIVRDGHNRGLSYRLNQAAAMARGKYIARMDHDDLSHPDRFVQQVNFLEANPHVDLLATQCLTMDEQDGSIGVLPFATDHAAICRRPWRGFYMAHPSWMGRTEWFLRNPYFEPAPYCCEDQELLLRAHESSCYHTIPIFLLAYRVRAYIPWKKQFRTRIEMGKMQVHHFLRQGKLRHALLSCLIGLLRIGRDGKEKLRQRMLPSRRVSRRSARPPEEYKEWEALISLLKKTVKHPTGKENSGNS